jgi:hypothetical protein
MCRTNATAVSTQCQSKLLCSYVFEPGRFCNKHDAYTNQYKEFSLNKKYLQTDTGQSKHDLLAYVIT